MTMFPAAPPQLPQEFVDAVAANPTDFGAAMGSGMDAFQAVMDGGGSMEDAFEAFGDTAGPMMGDLGISPEVFEAVGDMVGATAGPALMMGPEGAGAADMGAVMSDAITLMMPEDQPMPPEVETAMMDMGQTMADSGVGAHDVATEIMAPPGEPGYPMPCDADGGPVMVPGDPESVPMTDNNGEPILQAPPVDGACADTGTMMPPEGGYNHPPMGADMVMPEPYDALTADGGPMATPDPTGALSGAENIAPVPTIGEEGFVEAAPVPTPPSPDGADAMAAAFGEPIPQQSEAEAAEAAADVAAAVAMDTATEQGGGNEAPVPVIGDPDFVEASPVDMPAGDSSNDDGSAGMG